MQPDETQSTLSETFELTQITAQGSLSDLTNLLGKWMSMRQKGIRASE